MITFKQLRNIPNNSEISTLRLHNHNHYSHEDATDADPSLLTMNQQPYFMRSLTFLYVLRIIYHVCATRAGATFFFFLY